MSHRRLLKRKRINRKYRWISFLPLVNFLCWLEVFESIYKENVPKKEFALASGVNNVTSISFLFLEHTQAIILSEHNFVLMSNILQTCLRRSKRNERFQPYLERRDTFSCSSNWYFGLLVKDRFELWIVGKELFLSYKLISKQRLTQAFISQNIDLPLVLSHSSHLLAKSALPYLSFHSRLIPEKHVRKKLTSRY